MSRLLSAVIASAAVWVVLGAAVSPRSLVAVWAAGLAAGVALAARRLSKDERAALRWWRRRP